MARDITLRATRRRLEDLGYVVTSANHPSRVDDTHYSTAGRTLSLQGMSDHPAAILMYPTPQHAPEFADEPRLGLKRGIVGFILTAYLLSDSRQSKAVMSVLERRKLTNGPYRIDDFGNRTYPLQWNSSDGPLWRRHSACQTHPDDDQTVIVQPQTDEPQYRYVQNQFGVSLQVPISNPLEVPKILELAGDWRQGHILDTPRNDLPELLEDELREIIGDVERARWGARPAATTKEAA